MVLDLILAAVEVVLEGIDGLLHRRRSRVRAPGKPKLPAARIRTAPGDVHPGEQGDLPSRSRGTVH